MTDRERLDKLVKLLESKKQVHTNPVEIGVADLEWLLIKAAQAISLEMLINTHE